ncbi:MAG TPA: SCO family protein [Bryobacteraceae bacterium]|nr:SCO family protein [Bryobacteraceae bacterium]
MAAIRPNKGTALLAALMAVGLGGCAKPTPLPTLGVIPEFNLVDQSGNRFSSKERLDGRIWVADFIFTNCAGPCPRMSRQMKTVSEQFSGVSDLQLISFTVDPARDTPEVMAEYARRYAANPATWSFLTGSVAELQTLCRDAFMLGNVDGKLEHSTRFVLVDRKARIRGFYDSSDPAHLAKIITDIKDLRKDNT